jgi:hypothetical protein
MSAAEVRVDLAEAVESALVCQSLLRTRPWQMSGRNRRPNEGSLEMPRYLISFDDGAMDHIPDEEGPAVGEAAHAVIQEAQDAGVWVFAGGVYPHDEVSPKVVAPDGAVIDAR